MPVEVVGGLLDGLVHDFARGADVLAWRLVDPGTSAGAGRGDEPGCAPGDVGHAAGHLLSAGDGGEWSLPGTLDLRDLLGGGSEGAAGGLLDGIDLEAALQRALNDVGRGDATGHSGHAGGSWEAGACEPAGGTRPEADTRTSSGCGDDDAQAPDAAANAGGHELGWSAGNACQSPLAGLLDSNRSHGEGC